MWCREPYVNTKESTKCAQQLQGTTVLEGYGSSIWQGIAIYTENFILAMKKYKHFCVRYLRLLKEK